jgi:hypothetical protein
MFIRYGNKFIEIKDNKNSTELEIKFNLSIYGRAWSEIGDALYYFCDIEVNEVQFSFMKELASKNLSQSSFSIVL